MDGERVMTVERIEVHTARELGPDLPAMEAA